MITQLVQKFPAFYETRLFYWYQQMGTAVSCYLHAACVAKWFPVLTHYFRFRHVEKHNITITVLWDYWFLITLLPANKRRDSSVVQRWARSWMIGVRIPAEARNFSLHHHVPTGFGARPASYSMGTRNSFPGSKNGRGVKLTTHLHLVPRSRMRGAIPPFPQYAFMAWCWVKAWGQLFTLYFQ
jgi:hypothetical protein